MAITGPCYPLDHRLARQIRAGPQHPIRTWLQIVPLVRSQPCPLAGPCDADDGEMTCQKLRCGLTAYGLFLIA